jgi:hypothetical protein
MADGFTSYGWSQGLSDALGGYMEETGRIRDENERRNQQQLDLEKTALQHLMTSDDPGVKAAAITAWLQPRKAGPGPLAKWFGQQQASPAFQQVQTILGPAGKAPWLTVKEREQQQTAGQMSGRLGGAFDTYTQQIGQPPPKEYVEQTIRGALGAPERTAFAQPGTLVYEDQLEGQPRFESGSFDPGAAPAERYYTRAGAAPTRPFRWVTSGQERSQSGGRWFRHKASGQYAFFGPEATPTGEWEVVATSQPPNPQMIPSGPGEPAQLVWPPRNPNDPIQTRQVPNTERPLESVRDTYNRLAAQVAEIERQASAEDPGILGRDRASYLDALEFWAQNRGHGSFKALLDQRNEFARRLTSPQGAVQPPAPIDTAQTNAPPGPLTPQAAPAAAATAPATAQPTAGRGGGRGNRGNIDVNRVLELIRQRKATSMPAPAR